MLRRLIGVLFSLGVVLTPAIALLHSHRAPLGVAEHHAPVGHAPHDPDHHPRHDDHAPSDDGEGTCGLCDLVHQARADLCTPVPTPPAPALTGHLRQSVPDCPPRSRTALLDAPPRGPPAL